jgi:hypothetical protein
MAFRVSVFFYFFHPIKRVFHPIKRVKNGNGSYLYRFVAAVLAVTNRFYLKPWWLYK